MDSKTLGEKLLEAYSIENLNKISVTLIRYYQNEQFGVLRRIADTLNDFIHIEIDDEGKGFSKLMLLYHPDRVDFHKAQILGFIQNKSFDQLLEYSHILHLERIEEIANAIESIEDIDYSPVYAWDIGTHGFRIISDIDLDAEPAPTDSRRKGMSFYDALKIRIYGHTNIDFPAYYLEDFEEFEMSAAEISDLEGIQSCIHAKSFNLSDNYIFDLEPLAALSNLEELDLSENEIGYVDAISHLSNLRSINFMNNNITDITPLFGLEKLAYVCLTGNPIPPLQIAQLEELGIKVE